MKSHQYIKDSSKYEKYITCAYINIIEYVYPQYSVIQKHLNTSRYLLLLLLLSDVVTLTI